MVALNVNLTGVEPSMGSLPIKAEGWYTGMIVKTESKSTKAAQERKNNNAFLECTINFQDGSVYVERLNLFNDNPDAVRIANQQLSAMVIAMGANPQIADSSQLHNLPFELFLAVEEAKDDTGKVRTQNRMKAVRCKDGKIIGNVPTNGAVAGASGTGAATGFAPQPSQGGFAPPQGGAPQPGQPAPGFGGQPQPGQPAPGQPAGFAPAQQNPQPAATQQGWPGQQPQPGAPAQGAWPGQGGGAPAQGQQWPGQGGGQPQPGGFGGGGQPGWGGPQS